MAKTQSLTVSFFRRSDTDTTRAATPVNPRRPLFNLATLQINFAVVGLVVVAAFLTRPNHENAYVIEAHTGQQSVVRANPLEIVPSLVTLGEATDTSTVNGEAPSPEISAIAASVEQPAVDDMPPLVIKPKSVAKVEQPSSRSESEAPREPTPRPQRSSDTVVASAMETGTINKNNLPQNNDELAASLYNDAVTLLNEGRITEVEYRLKYLVGKYPLYVKAAELLTAIYLEQGKGEDAINVLEQSTRKVDSEQRLNKWLVKLYVDNNRHEQAIELTKAMLSKQLDADTLALLAALYQQAGQNEDAKNLYDAAIELNSSDYKVWLGYAVVLENLGDNENARQAYIMAQNLNSNMEVNGFIKSRLDLLEYSGRS